MTTPRRTVTEPEQWGVQWTVPVFPDGTLPEQPLQPAPVDYEGLTDEEAQAAEAQLSLDYAAYGTLMAAWRDQVATLAQEHDEYWKPTVSTYPDETQARNMLVIIRDAKQGDPFTRDVVLVTAPAITWTVVEE